MIEMSTIGLKTVVTEENDFGHRGESELIGHFRFLGVSQFPCTEQNQNIICCMGLHIFGNFDSHFHGRS